MAQEAEKANNWTEALKHWSSALKYAAGLDEYTYDYVRFGADRAAKKAIEMLASGNV